jgi:FixJ family two-component response regulator
MPVRKISHTLTPGNILLVDDNKLGLSARKCVLVVTDYKMPRMDGLELIAGLRKTQPDLPVILISGFVDALGLSEENTGADVVIQKSANEVSHLVRSVARLLRKKPVKKPAGSEGSGARKRKSV